MTQDLICKICSSTCTTEIELLDHLNIHAQDGNLKELYEAESDDSADFTGFHRMETVENGESVRQVYKCDMCSFTSDRLASVVIHLKNHKQFSVEMNLPRSENKKNISEPEFKFNDPTDKSSNDYNCKLCDFSSSVFAHMAEHLKCHKEVRDYIHKAIIKNKTDNSNRNSSAENLSKYYNCKLCEYSSDKFNEIADHLKSHSIIKNYFDKFTNRKKSDELTVKKMYVCKLCNFQSDKFAVLIVHLKCHSEVKNDFDEILGNNESDDFVPNKLHPVGNPSVREDAETENSCGNNKKKNVQEKSKLNLFKLSETIAELGILDEELLSLMNNSKTLTDNYTKTDEIYFCNICDFSTEQLAQLILHAKSHSVKDDKGSDIIKNISEVLKYNFNVKKNSCETPSDFIKSKSIQNLGSKGHRLSTRQTNKFSIFDEMLCSIFEKDLRISKSEKKNLRFVGLFECLESSGGEDAKWSFGRGLTLWQDIVSNYKEKYLTNNTETDISTFKNLNLFFNSSKVLEEAFEPEENQVKVSRKVKKSKKNILGLRFNLQKIYKCTSCHFCSTKKLFMLKHIKIVHPKMYKCSYCDYKNKKKNHLTRHLINRHENNGTFVCKICGIRFKSKHSLENHVQIHTIEKPFVCIYCPCSFSVGDHLKRHLRVHNEETPYSCSNCTYRTSRSNSLKAHMKIHQNKYICMICNLECTDYVRLIKHKKVHNPEKIFRCKFCEYSSGRLINIKIHRELQHSASSRNGTQFDFSLTVREREKDLTDEETLEKENLLICPYCGFETLNSSNMSKHIKTHEKAIITFSCKVCDFTCKRKTLLRLHVKNCHGQRLCKKCDYQAPHLFSLIYHKKTVHQKVKTNISKRLTIQGNKTRDDEENDVKPVFEIALSENDNFSGIEKDIFSSEYVTEEMSMLDDEQPVDYGQHLHSKQKSSYSELEIIIDDDESEEREEFSVSKNNKQFLCELCGETFTTRYSLKKHLLRHDDPNFDPTKNKKKLRKEGVVYKCEICDFIVNDEDSLIEHNNDYHTVKEPLKCGLCSFQTNRQFYLDCHYKAHRKAGLSCPTCDFQCGELKEFKKHLYKHSIEKLYKCDKCGMTFKCKNSLIMHYYKNLCFVPKKKISRLFPCPDCSFQTKYIEDFKVHLNEHKIKNEIEESHLNKESQDLNSNSKEQNLKSYIRKHYYDYTCHICNMQFISNTVYRSHLLKHLPPEPYKCSICNITFNKKTNLLTHLTNSHPIDNNGNKSPSPKNGAENISVRCKKKYNEEKKLTCTGCKFTCSDESLFKLHIFSHFINTS